MISEHDELFDRGEHRCAFAGRKRSQRLYRSGIVGDLHDHFLKRKYNIRVIAALPPNGPRTS